MPTRKTTRNAHHRAQRLDAELRDLELRAHSPETSHPRRKKRAPIWKAVRVLALVIFIAGGAELTAAALTSPRFQVAAVTVSGAQITPDADLETIENSLVGQNWVRAKTNAAQKKLLAMPSVKSVRIVRALHWPPSLHIALEERVPFARVGAGNDWWMVDENGVPFRRAEKSSAQNDESFYALTGPELQPQMGAPLPKEQWQQSKRLVLALNRAGSTPGGRWSLRRIYFDKNGFAALRLQGGVQDELLIRLGGDRWEEKLQRARTALAYFERSGMRAKSLNLVSYNVPQWTLRQPTADSGRASNPDSGA